ncbi:MAG: hypothetical protein DRQ48_01900 [Gammaproteobacteria bacterium]|nr:MAG: hypothetical protein DRQ48_01900 [Gammaproteobacteria bacterium]
MSKLEDLLAQLKGEPEPKAVVAFGVEENHVVALQPDGTRFKHYHRFEIREHANMLCEKVKAAWDRGVSIDMAYWELTS